MCGEDVVSVSMQERRYRDVVRSTYQSWSRKDEDYLMSEKRFKLVYEGRDLSTLLSEEGKFEQCKNFRFGLMRS